MPYDIDDPNSAYSKLFNPYRAARKSFIAAAKAELRHLSKSRD